MKQSTILAALLIGIAFAVAACGGSSDPDEPSLASRIPATAAVLQPTPTAQVIEQVIPKDQPTQTPILFIDRQKSSEELVIAMDEVLKLDPENAEAYYERGKAHRRLGNFQQAIEDFSEAVRLNPNHAAAYNYRGLVYKSLGQIDQAFSDMMEAATLVESLGRFDMERMIIGFLTGGQAAPYEDP